jgi:hypothetical protein
MNILNQIFNYFKLEKIKEKIDKATTAFYYYNGRHYEGRIELDKVEYHVDAGIYGIGVYDTNKSEYSHFGNCIFSISYDTKNVEIRDYGVKISDINDILAFLDKITSHCKLAEKVYKMDKKNTTNKILNKVNTLF